MRWTHNRKAEVLEELDRDPAKADEIMSRHGLSPEELQLWRRARSLGGDTGLAVKSIQSLRP